MYPRLPCIRRHILCRNGISHLSQGRATFSSQSQGITNSTSPFYHLEEKWKRRWSQKKKSRDKGVESKARNTREKSFIIPMFPYPSGMLHMGHVRVYTISDVLSRAKRMQGYDVIHPMGWDAFGLPTENAAIERNIDPAVWTKSNISKMKEAMDSMLADFDWDHEVVTCSPDYYKWTQKIFLLFYENGMAYRNKALVNWDPIEQTVLANEQVDKHGKSWRSGALVEQKYLSQWFLRITDYAERLYHDTDELDRWPERVKTMQKNWIGPSSGAEIVFTLQVDIPGRDKKTIELPVFTTRPDTLFGVSYIALSHMHPIIAEIAESDPQFSQRVAQIKNLDRDSKEGLLVTSVSAKFPSPWKDWLGSQTIPVFVAPYVLSDYGTGGVMGVPAHDTRDFEFYRQNGASLETITRVVDSTDDAVGDSLPFTKKDGFLNDRNPREFVGLTSQDAAEKIVSRLQENGTGKPVKSYRLRDWLISRQRYWGAPIPMIHCDSCGIVPVPDDQLPVLLPETVPPLGSGSPLSRDDEWLHTKCPKCHGPAKRDTDTMDTFVDSSWYYFRYIDPDNDIEPFGFDKTTKYMPVDVYVGGVEHAILHLLYSRFFSKFLADQGKWAGGYKDLAEPFACLLTQGMVLGKTYKDPKTGAFLKPDQVEFIDEGTTPVKKGTNTQVSVSFEKMSKSKHNGTDPIACIERHGADATRAHILFKAPVSEELEWEEDSIVGVQRWLQRVHQTTLHIAESITSAGGISWPLQIEMSNLNNEERELWQNARDTIDDVSLSLRESFSLNTVISDLIILTNNLVTATKKESVSLGVKLQVLITLNRLMAPVTPVIAEECWEIISNALGVKWTSVFDDSWPEMSKLPKNIIQMTKYKVMVNGKFRFVVEGPQLMDRQQLIELAKSAPQASKWLLNNPPSEVFINQKAGVVNFLYKK